MTESPSRRVVAPGNYDGVHRGHQRILEVATAYARARGLRTSVLFFDPHPAAVLNPDRAPVPLTTVERRKWLLTAAGVDDVHVQPFDPAFAALSPRDFVERVLVDELGAAAVAIGADFRFGRERAGDVTLLLSMAKDYGFEVLQTPPFVLTGNVVSSSRIRAEVSSGRVAEAAHLLGRVHDVTGRVVRGDGRGRSLGFATANLVCEPVLLPADGVYAVVGRDLDRDEPFAGVANLGVRPTFGAGRSVEVHRFDFDGDMYEHRLRIGFVQRVRSEQRFSGIDELTAQIARDVDAARVAVSSANAEATRWV